MCIIYFINILLFIINYYKKSYSHSGFIVQVLKYFKTCTINPLCEYDFYNYFFIFNDMNIILYYYLSKLFYNIYINLLYESFYKYFTVNTIYYKYYIYNILYYYCIFIDSNYQNFENIESL